MREGRKIRTRKIRRGIERFGAYSNDTHESRIQSDSPTTVAICVDGVMLRPDKVAYAQQLVAM